MQQTVLITGATDGIGLALARCYSRRGCRLVLVGRRQRAQLNDPLFSESVYCCADLAEPDCGDRVLSFLEQQQVATLDVVIHNAGVGEYGAISAHSADSVDQLLSVNLAAPIRLTHALFPRTVSGARLVYISSALSNLPAPLYPHYLAGKAALEGFARSLRIELDGVAKVLVIRPGATRTGLFEKSGIAKEQLDWTRFPPAESVAKRMLRAIDQGRERHTIGLGNRGLRLAGWLPGLLDRVSRPSPGPVSAASDADEPTVFITGAADGIGRSLAFRFGRAGYRVLGVDRDVGRSRATEAALQQEGVEVSWLVADLAKDDERDAVSQWLQGNRMDVVIHNAGINATGAFVDQALPDAEQVFRVNLLAPLLLNAEILRNGLVPADGCFVFIGSLSTFVSYPGAAVYAATKDGIASYARSLCVAERGTRSVLTVFPGPTRTEHARRHSPDNRKERNRMHPDTLADQIFRAMARNKATLILGGGNKLAAFLGKVCPALMEYSMRRLIWDKIRQSRAD